MAALRVVSLRDPKPRDRPPARAAADRLGSLEVYRVARAAVPNSRAASLPRAGYERATDRMARALGAGQKPERVCPYTPMCR